MEKLFEAKDSELDNVLDFLNDSLAGKNISMKFETQLSVCLEEMFVNVANYAYPDKDGSVLIDIITDGSKVIVTLKDTGIPYNPLEKEDPDVTLGVEERAIGGLGIYMVKKLMDEVHYEYKEGKNIFSFIKILS